MWLIKLKYYLGCIMALPLLPLMARHGKLVKDAVPELPAPTDITGAIPEGSTPQFHLITIGESTVAGVGVSHHREGLAGSLAMALAEQTGLAVGWHVYAKSGFTAGKVNQNIIPNIPSQPADLIVIGLGANDAFQLNSPMKWAKNIKRVIESVQLKFPQTPIVMLNMPPIKRFPAMTWLLKLTLGNLVILNGEALEQVVKKYQDVYYHSERITLENWSKKHNIVNDTDQYFSDGIHPSQLTYALWAKDVSAYIKEQNILSGK